MNYDSTTQEKVLHSTYFFFIHNEHISWFSFFFIIIVKTFEINYWFLYAWLIAFVLHLYTKHPISRPYWLPYFVFSIAGWQVNSQYGTRSIVPSQKFDSTSKWEEYKEAIPTYDKTSLRQNILLEQMSTTKDESDYLWYTLR